VDSTQRGDRGMEAEGIAAEREGEDRGWLCGYPSTLANSTLIILFSEMLKFSKIISSKSKNIVKENSEYLRIFHFLK